MNRGCGKQFHSYENNPECPRCGCVRVSWVPGGGHIGKVAPGADATLRMLAADYGLSNLNSVSPSRVNHAAPAPDRPAAHGSRGIKHWAPGFSSEVYDAPHCAPSLTPPNLKGFQAVGRVFPKGTDMRYLGTTPLARHRPGG